MGGPCCGAKDDVSRACLTAGAAARSSPKRKQGGEASSQAPQPKRVLAWCVTHNFSSLVLFRCSQIWDTFMESIEPFARHIPYMVRAQVGGERGDSIRMLGGAVLLPAAFPS